MTTQSRIAALMVLAFANSAIAELPPRESDYVNYWFSDDGVPQAQAQRWAAAQGLPPLVSGAPFRQDLAAVGQTTTASCVVIQFQVRPDGLTDKFAVLDSQPPGRLDAMVLDSLKFWKFESRNASTWTSIHYQLAGSKDVRTQSTGTRIGPRWRECVVPKVSVDSALPMGNPVEAPRPFFPPAEVAKRAQGCVTLGFSVRTDGLADEYEVIDAKPGKTFLNAAMAGLNDWKFAPQQPAPSARGAVRFTYALDGGKGDVPECKLPSGGTGASK